MPVSLGLLGDSGSTLDILEKLATAIGLELVVGVGAQLSENRSIVLTVVNGKIAEMIEHRWTWRARHIAAVAA